MKKILTWVMSALLMGVPVLLTATSAGADDKEKEKASRAICFDNCPVAPEPMCDWLALGRCRELVCGPHPRGQSIKFVFCSYSITAADLHGNSTKRNYIF